LTGRFSTNIAFVFSCQQDSRHLHIWFYAHDDRQINQMIWMGS